ncbi:MAG TPA: hypothetical protein VK832_04785 [Burkholderiaceae bacterium]|nr:hypothetical protein [Burkholderiaceae bacterium]
MASEALCSGLSGLRAKLGIKFGIGAISVGMLASALWFWYRFAVTLNVPDALA